MTNTDIKANWYYFRSLAKQLHDTEQYVDHSIDSAGKMINGSTFSNEFAKLLMLTASEFEVVGKTLCVEAGKALNWNADIKRITREITGAFPNIGNTNIVTPYQTIQPLKDWKIVLVPNEKGTDEKVNGIPWWEYYNSVKHNRRKAFRKANLQNSVYSMAALMVLELYLSQRVLGNLYDITSIGCEYFDCNYGLSHLVANNIDKLPDFK